MTDDEKIQLIVDNFRLNMDKQSIASIRNHIRWGEIELTDKGFECAMLDVEYVGTHQRLPLAVEYCYRFMADNGSLTTLQGCPHVVQREYRVSGDLSNLEFLPQKAHSVELTWMQNLGLLRLLNVECDQVKFWASSGTDVTNSGRATEIINKYLRKGWAAMVPCARELIRAGLKGNATL